VWKGAKENFGAILFLVIPILHTGVNITE